MLKVILGHGNVIHDLDEGDVKPGPMSRTMCGHFTHGGLDLWLTSQMAAGHKKPACKNCIKAWERRAQ